MLTLPSGETVLGDLVDLSVGGAGMMLNVAAAKLTRGMRLAVLIEANDLPDPSGDGAVISVRAVVASVVLLGRGASATRFGLEFSQEPPGLAARLAGRQGSWPLAEGTGPQSAVEAPGPALAQTPQGREILFQHARACLAAGNPAGAVAAMTWALEGAPANPAYKVLRHRAVAEEAFARSERATAVREAQAALALAPGAAEVVALVARVSDGDAGAEPSRPKARGLLGRLFSR